MENWPGWLRHPGQKTNSTMIRKTTALLFILFPLLQAKGYAQAGFAVSLETQVLRVKPGTSVRGSLTIATHGINKVSHFEIKTLDLGQDASGDIKPVPKGTGSRSCANWIEIVKKVDILPGEIRTVPFTVRVPPNATGAYYGFIEVTHIPESPEREKMVVMVQPSISVRIEVETPRNQRLALEPISLKFTRNLKTDGRPGLILKVKNTGNMKVSFEGDILLYKKKRVFPIRVEIPLDGNGNPHTLYPGLTETIECPFSEFPTPGDYRAEVRLLMQRRWRLKSIFKLSIPKSAIQFVSAGKSIRKTEFDIDVGVEPNFEEIVLPAGATRTLSIRMFNRENKKVEAKAFVQKVTQERNGFLTFGDFPSNENPWVVVTPSKWTLQPLSSRSILLEITAPNYDKNGVAMCAVRILGTAGVDASNWISEADIGVPIVVVPPNSPPPKLNIEDLRVVRPAPGKNPTAAVLLVKNDGGRTAKIKGKMVLERLKSGQRIQTMTILRGDNLILPHSKREFRMPISYLDKGEFRLRARVSLIGQNEEKSAMITFNCFHGPDY